jgi:hypothetical protein
MLLPLLKNFLSRVKKKLETLLLLQLLEELDLVKMQDGD